MAYGTHRSLAHLSAVLGRTDLDIDQKHAALLFCICRAPLDVCLHGLPHGLIIVCLTLIYLPILIDLNFFL